MSTLPTRVTIPPDVLFRELDGECTLLNLTTEHYYTLDDIGTHMWQLLVEEGDTQIVLQKMLNEYDVDEATLRQDMVRLIDELAQARLIAVEG